MSLDGVVQAPGGPTEDESGGFTHGGWSIPYFDPEAMGPVIGDVAERCEALLQGSRTYRVSADAWPERGGGKTLFPSDSVARSYELISAQTASTGVQICRYQPARSK